MSWPFGRLTASALMCTLRHETPGFRNWLCLGLSVEEGGLVIMARKASVAAVWGVTGRGWQ